MELRHLRYFVAVAEALSFRRAAERLHLSHPALSEQISDLENELGMKFFDRNRRRVELTEAGRIFLAGARRTLVSAQEAVAQAKEAIKGERGRLSIGNIGSLCQAFLPDALARFRQRFPLVEVTVVHMNSRRQIDALLNDSIMLGIGLLGPNRDDESLTATELLQSPICVVCSEHRWPAKRRIPKLVDFRYDDFLTQAPEAAPDYLNLVRTACLRDGGFEPKLLPTENTFDSLISMVAAGRGVLISSEIVLRNLHLPAAVNSYILEDSQSKFELFLLRKKESEPAATVNNFAKILFKSVRHLQSHSKEAAHRRGRLYRPGSSRAAKNPPNQPSPLR
jgi:DNA-binding transcriptional LysR family regulator